MVMWVIEVTMMSIITVTITMMTSTVALMHDGVCVAAMAAMVIGVYELLVRCLPQAIACGLGFLLVS